MSIVSGDYREIATVLMHLPGSMTKVELERFRGVGIAGGEVTWDLETETIPVHLRAIGSRFVVVGRFIRQSEDHSAEDLHALMRMRPEIVELGQS
ncbi:hypothetical protein [Nocardioides baekrokdamisoli]|uniref:hypothetical protein n=1 Tax=Nocardioides baekrokdamisoli TaxID=1804624 RepID=UPI000F79B024|nr:hypothetical protein [Nocardioides baekrokdamisoli]